MAKMVQRPSPTNREIHRLAENERLRLGHPYFGDEHLLLGMLAHATNPAATILTVRGLDLTTVRTDIARIVAALGPVARDGATVLHELGIDVEQMRRQLESTFGTLAVHEAARQVRRRPWWRGGAHHSPICGPPYLIKRAQLFACTTAGTQGFAEIQPEHMLYGVLRDARDPLGTGLGRRGRREASRLGLPIGTTHPIRILLTEHGINIEKFSDDLLATATRG